MGGLCTVAERCDVCGVPWVSISTNGPRGHFLCWVGLPVYRYVGLDGAASLFAEEIYRVPVFLYFF